MKRTIYNLQFTIYNLILILVLVFTFVSLALAQETAGSDISEDEVKEKIKERLEQVVDEKLEKVKGDLIKKTTEKVYGYSGKIALIEDSVLTIETASGNKTVEVASGAAILKVSPGKSKSDIKIEDLEKDDFIIVMGFKEKDVLLGKRLIVSPSPAPPPAREILTGKVKEVDDQKITFAKNGDGEKSITIDKNTKLKVNGIKKPTTEDIQIDDLITTIVTLDKNDKIDEVKIVLIIPGKSNPAAEENEVEATPSAASENSSADTNSSIDANKDED